MAAFIARFGEAKWRARGEEQSAIWDAISDAVDRAIARFGKHPQKVKLYRDSLPVCDHQAAMVAQLTAQGSENHKLLSEQQDAAGEGDRP